MFSGDVQPQENIVTVAESGGDFTDPAAALASIIDAEADKRYIIKIEPGTYTLTQTLFFKRFVTIEGSGAETTLLKGAVSSSFPGNSVLVRGYIDAELRNLNIENTGGSDYSVGVSTISTGIVLGPRGETFKVESVSIKVSGATNNYGVYHAGGPSFSNPIGTSFSRIFINNAIITAAGNNSIGVFNGPLAVATISHSSISASGTLGYGVNSADCIVGISATCGFEGSTIMNNSTVYGSTAGVRFGSTMHPILMVSSESSGRYTNVRIDGGIPVDPPGSQCSNTFIRI